MTLIFVDVEAVGPSVSTGRMTEFGAVEFNTRRSFHGILDKEVALRRCPNLEPSPAIDMHDRARHDFLRLVAERARAMHRERHMIDFTHLSRAAEQAGLQAVDRGKGHWQVHGGTFLVNFYPFGSRGPTLYVAGSASGKRLKGSSEEMIEAVIQAASRPPRRAKTEHSKRKNWNSKERLREKRRLFYRGHRRCYWCRCLLVLKREDEDEERRFATIEHKVPLGAGGLENPNNRVLACEGCNKSRGDDTAAPAARQEEKT